MLIAHEAITCPHCWQRIEIAIDLSVPEQSYVEDCSVCCRPIVIHYEAHEGALVRLEASAENET